MGESFGLVERNGIRVGRIISVLLLVNLICLGEGGALARGFELEEGNKVCISHSHSSSKSHKIYKM